MVVRGGLQCCACYAVAVLCSVLGGGGGGGGRVWMWLGWVVVVLVCIIHTLGRVAGVLDRARAGCLIHAIGVVYLVFIVNEK